MLLNISLKNFKHNSAYYRMYIVSVTVVLAVFFAFSSFAANDIMLSKISSDGRVETMSRTISVFLMAFVLFFMSYSNQHFLRNRSKELGIYAMLGYRKSKIVGILLLENTYICTVSLLFGVLFGAFLHKAIVFTISGLLNLGINTASIPLFNVDAIIASCLFVVVVVLFLLFSNIRAVAKVSILEFVKLDKKEEKKSSFNFFTALGGVIFLLLGYFLALDILRGKNSFWYTIGFSPIAMLTVVLVCVGTFFSIYSFLPWLYNKMKNRKKQFYRPIPIVTMPNLAFRIRTRAKTIIMLTFLLAATLSVVGALALSLYYPIMAVSRLIPSEIECRIENAEQAEAMEEIVNRYSNDATVQFTNLIYVTSSSANLPEEYYLGSNETDTNAARTPKFECISESDWLSLLSAQGRKKEADGLFPLAKDECLAVKYRPDDSFQPEEYILNGEIPLALKVKASTFANPIGFANSIGTLVISDAAYHNLSKATLETIQVMSVNGGNLSDNQQLFEELQKASGNSPYLMSAGERISEIMYYSSSTFLLLGFLVVLFFIAAGSILYFSSVSEISASLEEYKILGFIGYSSKQIKKIINSQVLVFFAIPLLLGLLHSVFAIICYKTALVNTILQESMALYYPVLLAYAIALLIFGIYYFITARSCRRLLRPKNAAP